MAKTTYNISLKGYVGGSDFDRSTVDRELARHDGKQVNVLIDSLGGSLATGLSISAAFRNHGNVNVHFVGLNASAATIASLGAAHISIDTGAMYLVLKCSMAFFEWGSLNSGDPVDISVWKSDGSILELLNVISLRYSFYGGWRNIKLLHSGQMRKIRDCCIFRINDCEVFL